MVEFREYLFTVILNSCVLLIVLFLFAMILDVEDMEKRQYCRNYIYRAHCWCEADVEQLLNDSVKIANLYTPLPESEEEILDNNFKRR